MRPTQKHVCKNCATVPIPFIEFNLKRRQVRILFLNVTFRKSHETIKTSNFIITLLFLNAGTKKQNKKILSAAKKLDFCEKSSEQDIFFVWLGWMRQLRIKNHFHAIIEN